MNTELVTLAAQAVAGIAASKSQLDRAVSTLAFVATQSQHEDVHFYVTNAKGEVLIDCWTPMDMALDRNHRANMLDGKHTAKLLECVVGHLSGVRNLSPYQREKVQVAFDVALGLMDRFGEACMPTLDDDGNMIEEGAVQKSRSGYLKVPYHTAFDAPGDKATDSERDHYEAHRDDMLAIDGGKNSINLDRFKSRVARKAERDATDAGQGAPKVDVDPWAAAVRTKLGNATFRGKPAKEWAEYIADLTAEELCRAAFLLAQASGDADA